jgi:uncharacterized protein with PIN domain
VKIKKGGDLIFWTYYMVDWSSVVQTPSDHRCVQCGGKMMKVGPVEDAKGSKYDGLVCHTCKRVVWATGP